MNVTVEVNYLAYETINDSYHSNPYIKSRDNKKKLPKTKNNNITTNDYDNKNDSNNRDYKNIDKSKQR